MNFTIAQLRYIVALDTYRHYVTAAENCFVTQPTLSMQIKKLEEDLGVIIFDRSKQPVVPTELGEQIIQKARDVIRSAEKIEQVIQDQLGEVKGELIIGVIPTLAPYLLPKFIGPFSRKYPDLHIVVRELQTAQIIDLLKKDMIDVGILVTPLNEKGISEKPIFYDEFKVYVSDKNPLVKKDKISTDELIQNKIWLLTEGNCFRTQTVNLCAMEQIERPEGSFEYESGSLQTLINMVDREGGVTLIPEIASLDLRKKQQNQIKSLKGKDTSVREVSLVYARNYAKRKVIDLLYKMIKKSIPEQLLDKKQFKVVHI